MVCFHLHKLGSIPHIRLCMYVNDTAPVFDYILVNYIITTVITVVLNCQKEERAEEVCIDSHIQ